MPAVSRAQRRLAGADLERAKEGRPTRTGMTEQQLADFAATPERGLPTRVRTGSYRRRTNARRHG